MIEVQDSTIKLQSSLAEFMLSFGWGLYKLQERMFKV